MSLCLISIYYMVWISSLISSIIYACHLNLYLGISCFFIWIIMGCNIWRFENWTNEIRKKELNKEGNKQIKNMKCFKCGSKNIHAEFKNEVFYKYDEIVDMDTFYDITCSNCGYINKNVNLDKEI